MPSRLIFRPASQRLEIGSHFRAALRDLLGQHVHGVGNAIDPRVQAGDLLPLV